MTRVLSPGRTFTAGDDKLNASDLRLGLRLLANGTSANPAVLENSESPPSIPAMFEEDPSNCQAIFPELPWDINPLSSHEINQVVLAIRAAFA